MRGINRGGNNTDFALKTLKSLTIRSYISYRNTSNKKINEIKKRMAQSLEKNNSAFFFLNKIGSSSSSLYCYSVHILYQQKQQQQQQKCRLVWRCIANTKLSHNSNVPFCRPPPTQPTITQYCCSYKPKSTVYIKYSHLFRKS